MQKIVLLAINSKYVHSTLAVWLLAQSIKELAPVVVETNINQEIDSIVAEVTYHNPDIIGISCYIWNAKIMPEVIKQLKLALPNAKILMGGPEAVHNADFWLNQGACEVLYGEGEKSLPAYFELEPQEFVDPFTPQYLQALKGKIAYIESSRGCPFNCAYCLSGTDPVRHFPLEIVKEQIRKLITADVRIIKFVDRTFNCNAKRVYELIEFLIGLNSPVKFHFEVAADLFDERTLQLLATAPPGLIQIEIGLQSFFAPTLKASTRTTNLNKAIANIKTLLKPGNIHIHLDLIAGLPHEDLTQFANSFNQAYEIGAHKLQLGFLKLLHGSQMRKTQTEMIYDPQPPYEIIKSPWMSEADFKTLHITENALQHTHNKEHFLETITYAMQASNLTPYDFYFRMGHAFQKDKMALELYAGKIFEFCKSLPGVEEQKLIYVMICDWLQMVKGVNMPSFLKMGDKKQIMPYLKIAETNLGLKLRRNEVAILPNGCGVYVDANIKNPVTGLYKLHFIENQEEIL